MENRLKLQFSRLFRSCRTRDLSDILEKSVFVPQSSNHSLPPPSICKTKSTKLGVGDFINPKHKVSDRNRYSPFLFADTCGSGGCPCPYSSSFYYDRDKKQKKKKRSKRTSRLKTTHREARHFLASTSQDSTYYSGSYGGWSSGVDVDDERENETETLFSSKRALSSDSSVYRRRKNRRIRRRRRVGSRSFEVGLLPLDQGSFAVVKKSSDPHSDFRTSMVEMIVEKQIFGGLELEELLQLFLSLNSDSHHRIIVEVFMEIYEALFSDWS